MALLDIVNSFPLAMNAQQGGLSGLLQQEAQQPLQQPIPEVQKPRPSAFAQGGKGWEIVGIIGDALAAAGGGQATYGPMMAQQRELETKGRQRLAELLQQQQQRQAERDAAFERDKALIDYRNANPGMDSFDRAVARGGFAPDKTQGLYAKRAEMLTNPVQLVPDGVGGYQAVRPNESSGLPQGYDPSEWELVPGDAGGNASAGFPGSY